MKIYTRTGDDGSTSVLGPVRLPKSDARIEAYGTVDELNAALGFVRAADPGRWLTAELDTLQRRLFQVGAELATTDERMFASFDRLTDTDVAEIEGWIDRFEADLPPLKQFVLPAGGELASRLHLARTICRRAERRVVAVALGNEAVEPRLIRYLNRVADLLFVMARWSNRRAGVSDEEWHGRR